MIAKLSDKLAELSVATRKAEDAATNAQKETSNKIEQLRDEAHADAQRRIAGFNAKLSEDNAKASSRLDAWKAKGKADIEALKSKIDQKKHMIDVKHKERHADDLETDAAFAIDYAIYSVENAHAAVLDAMSARIAASEAAKS